jgi:hypothetical protein
VIQPAISEQNMQYMPHSKQQIQYAHLFQVWEREVKQEGTSLLSWTGKKSSLAPWKITEPILMQKHS